jgi:1-aminocyclopropane-1-carboxylate deaminase
VQVFRTDLLHPIISGNKWMKLQPWLKKAKEQGRTGIITKGGPWSNHVHAAAYACQQQKLSFTAIVKAHDAMSTLTLTDIKSWGGQIVFTQQDLYKNEAYWAQVATTQNALYIPMGGEGTEGIQGVADFINTINAPSFDYIVCSVGTGTTYKGVAASNWKFKQLIGADPGIYDTAYSDIIQELSQQFPTKSFVIKHNKSLKKFGKWPAFLPEKMNSWMANWKLPTDIIYTAKMVYQFEEWVAEGFFEKNSRILLIHTGGLQGNRSVPQGLLKY